VSSPHLRREITGIALLVFAVFLGVPRAQADHLKCYKIKDSLPKTTYNAQLTDVALATGCAVKLPGKLLCVDSTKTNVNPQPPGGGPTGQNAGRYVCYRIKCATSPIAPVSVLDQFGSRIVQRGKARMLCAPSS